MDSWNKFVFEQGLLWELDGWLAQKDGTVCQQPRGIGRGEDRPAESGEEEIRGATLSSLTKVGQITLNQETV